MTDLILFISSILSIILFFKVWAMTNNVKNIESKLNKILACKEQEQGDFTSDVMFYIYNKRFAEAKELLQKNMWNHYAMRNLVSAKTEAEFDDAYRMLKQDYIYWFQLIGETFPSFNHMREIISNVQ